MNIKAFLDTQANYNALSDLEELARLPFLIRLTEEAAMHPAYKGLAQSEVDAILTEINAQVLDMINTRKEAYGAILEQTTITLPDIE